MLGHQRCSVLVQFLALLAFSGAQSASATSLTMFVDGVGFPGGAIAASPGQTIEVGVGLDDVFEVRQYNLDIVFDTSELQLTGASQLACLVDSGACTLTPSFMIDPTDPGSASVGRRAAILTTPPSYFTIDTSETGNAYAAFFSVEFTVLAGLLNDGHPDITIGILDSSANEVTDLSNESVALAADTVSAMVVPEPSTGLLLLLSLAGLVLVEQRR